MTAPADGPGEPRPPRYHLRIPPLSLARYRRASVLLATPFLRGRPWRGAALGLGLGIPVGAAAGFAIVWSGARLTVLLTTDHPERDLLLSNLHAVLALLALASLAFGAIALATARRNARMLRRVHAATRVLHGTNDLLLREDGLEWITPDGTLTHRWAGVAAPVRDGDVHYLRLDGLSFLWLPDSALGERREETLAFVADRIARAAAPEGTAG